ncbi:MAG: CoA pyrophosphatase [Deltaproteobacteria bacterium]|nr:CoA pyrophosphatase [Deltaproteobacteria bacterium]
MLKNPMSRFSLNFLKERLSLEPPLPAPEEGMVSAGVLLPLFLKNGMSHVLFTQRTLTVKDHKGQISFPGGVQHPEDPDLLTTALRETQEEIGLEPQVVEVLGSLKSIATITGYWVTGYVGVIPHPYEFHLNPREVARLLFFPLEGFCESQRWSTGNYTYQGRHTRVCYWTHDKTVIWGATARILLHFLARLGEHPVPGDREATCLD